MDIHKLSSVILIAILVTLIICISTLVGYNGSYTYPQCPVKYDYACKEWFKARYGAGTPQLR